jgi:hypothetical protein
MYYSSSEEEIQEVLLVQRQRNFRIRNNFHFHAEYEFSYQKKSNLHKNELNTKFFCSTSPLKSPNRLQSVKLG